MISQQKFLAFVFVCVIAAAGAGAAFLVRRSPPSVPLTSGLLLTPGKPLRDFSLIDTQGRSFGPADLRGHWSLMFFGYTNCPDVCPATLTTLAALQKRLRATAAAVRPVVVFVSVDAKRDTPAQLAGYVPYFDPEFIGLTAKDQPTIESVARNLGVAVIVHPERDGNYSVDHSGEIFVLDPEARLSAILTGPFTVDALLSDFSRLAAART